MPGALDISVLNIASQQAAALIASEMNAHLVALAIIAVNLQCILQRHQESYSKNKWAYHAASTTTSISAPRATTQRFTRKPAATPLMS